MSLSDKTLTALIISISILAALAILVSDAYLSNELNSNQVTYWIIAIWFVPFSYLSMLGFKKRNSA